MAEKPGDEHGGGASGAPAASAAGGNTGDQTSLEGHGIFDEEVQSAVRELENLSESDIRQRLSNLQSEMRRVETNLRHTNARIQRHEQETKENKEKLRLNVQLPYLVSNVVEVRFPWRRLLLFRDLFAE